MSLLLSAELDAACNALGSYKDKENLYVCENNTVEAVKDIIRYLRRDTENHEVRRYFGETNIVGKNLLPLLQLYWKQTDLFDVLLRLLGNLTSPVLLLYNEEVPKDKIARHEFLQILGHLQIYKHAFQESQIWSVLSTRLSDLLSIEWQERGTENGLIIERILILVRNVLSIPADIDDEKRADNDVSAHDKVLWALNDTGIVNTIHYMVSSDQEESYAMYLLEILSQMLKDHRAIDLAQVCVEKAESERRLDDSDFQKIRRKEQKERQERLKNYTSVRHSRFGGTYVFQNIKSVNDTQELIYHKKLNTADSLDFDVDKSKVKIAKNRKPVREKNSHRRSPLSIRLLLKEFCIEFLNSGYNKLMHVVRGKLVRGQSMENDESYYMWALRFFMEFNRQFKFDVKLVSETMGHEIFHYVQQRMEHNFDMISSDKKRWPLWSKRLHLGLLAYRELMYNINAMDKSTESTIREHAKVIKSNIFYVVEYSEWIVTLLAAYDEIKMSDAYLLDLLETQHIFVKMLEAYCGKNSTIVVQKIQRIKKKKKQKSAAAPVVSMEEALELKWNEVSPQLSTVLEGGENIPVLVPFDAASEVPINDQRKDAMIRIQDYLREGEIENSIGLLRAARDVWPDNDSFGSSSMTPEEEFLAIREIFFAKLRDKEEIPTKPAAESEEEDEEDEEDDEDGAIAVEKEVDFKFQDFVNRFSHPKVIQACGLALRRFDTNSVHVNHCILKLLHRIAWDSKMPAMLFQASIFRTFQRIFAEGNNPQFKELIKFSVFIVRQFLKVAEKNKKVFMELLFWKNTKDAFDIEEGYGTYETKSKVSKKAWAEEEENELRVLYMEYKERQIEEDPIDWLVDNLIDNTKSRVQIIRKMKELMLLEYKGKQKHSSASVRAKDWSETEITQITELYNQFKDAMDPLSCIMDRLEVKRPKARVKQKILELGLADNKALRKKRATKSGGHQEEEQHFTSRAFVSTDDDSSDNANSSSDEENENRSNEMNTRPKPRTKTKNTDKKGKRSTAKKQVKSQKLELPAAKKLILEIKEKDMTDSLKWVSECLIEAAEDQEQDINLDGNEGIPLVPINVKDMQAIKDSIFQKFLLGLGIQKPASEQEKFWRIPGNMLATELTKHAKFIDEIVQKGAEAFPEYDERPPEEQPQQQSSDDEDVFDRIRNFMVKPNNPTNEEPFYTDEITENVGEQRETNEDEVIIEHNLENGFFSNTSGSSKKSKKATVLSDSDDSDSEQNLENRNLSNASGSAKKSKTFTVLSDSDDSVSEQVKRNVLEQNADEIIEHNLENGFLPNASGSAKKSKKLTVLSDSDGSDSESVERNVFEHNKEDSFNKHNLNVSNSSKKISKISVLNDSDDSDSENIQQNRTVNNKENTNENANISSSNKKKSKRILSDSDESDNENRNKMEENIENESSAKKSNRISDESDESDLENIEKEDGNNLSQEKRNNTGRSGTDLTPSNNSEIISKRNRESDSESVDHSVKRKKLAIIDSDED